MADDAALDGIDDELDETKHVVDEHGEHVCDVDGCGSSFDSPSALGLHKRNAHGIAGKFAGRRRGNGKRKPRADGAPDRKKNTTGRRQKIRETIEETADLLDELQGQGAAVPDRLADILRMDADKLAGFLTVLADNVTMAGRFVDTFAGRGGPIAGLRAGWRIIGWLFRRNRQTAADARAVREEFTRLYNVELDERGEEAAAEFQRQVEAGEIEIVIP